MKPRFCATLFLIPKTTGEVMMDWASLTFLAVSPRDIQSPLAGQTASYLRRALLEFQHDVHRALYFMVTSMPFWAANSLISGSRARFSEPDRTTRWVRAAHPKSKNAARMAMTPNPFSSYYLNPTETEKC